MAPTEPPVKAAGPEARTAAPPPGPDRPWAGTRRARTPLAVLALTAALLAALTAAVSLGTTDIPPGEVWSVVLRRLTGEEPRPGTNDMVVWQLRVPRALLAALVCAGLGLVGAAAQALVRNPLADPYLLGISSGATLGAVAAMVLGVGAGGLLGFGLSGAAFAGAVLSFALVWAIARRGGGFAPLRLVLAGIGVGQFLSGATSYLVLQAGDQQQTQSILYWLLGSLGGATWDRLLAPLVAVLAGGLLLCARARALNALIMGDETAAGVGVDATRLRRELFIVSSVLTGVLVSVSGAIAFVGLMVPHVCRLVVGGDHRKLLPLCALTGALLLVVVDLVCRIALPAQELPVGVVTALIGAPTLLYLLDRRMGRDT